MIYTKEVHEKVLACPRCKCIPNHSSAKDLEQFSCHVCGLLGLWSLERIPSAGKEYFTVAWMDPNIEIKMKTPQELAEAYANSQSNFKLSMSWHDQRDSFLAGYESRNLEVDRWQERCGGLMINLSATEAELQSYKDQLNLVNQSIELGKMLRNE